MNRIPWLVAAFATAFGGAAAAAPPPAQPPQPASPTAAEVASWAAPCKVPGAPHPFYIVLDGKAAPLAQRQTVLTKLEQCAQNGSVSAQDFIGALYWMGDTLPDALVQRDPARALMYFSNAAAHGDIEDMPKLAEIELAGKRPVAAMVWAQLYGHYEGSSFSGKHAWHGDYLAELLHRIYGDLGPQKLPAVANDASAFLTKYDAGIHAYNAYQKQHQKDGLRQTAPIRISQPDSLQIGDYSGPLTAAGFADYLMAYKPDGSVDTVWLIDAFPTPHQGVVLRPIVMRARAARTGRSDRRFAMLRYTFLDRSYTLRKHG